ncbi:MAG: hypothetical protein MK135_10320, partial [Polyangiaceae bacterium]|nr:hypothetical protein [Polyangiaceae bacterium]
MVKFYRSAFRATSLPCLTAFFSPASRFSQALLCSPASLISQALHTSQASRVPLGSLVSLAALSLLGCETGPSKETTSREPTDSQELTEEQDPLGIGCDVQTILAKSENGCTEAGGHGARPQANLDLLSPGVGERLVGVAATGEACGGEPLINLDSPEQSLLLRKINPALFGDDGQTCGGIMPLNSEGVSDDDFACLKRWVLALADQTEVAGAISYKDEWENVSVESYLSKVKGLTNGGIVTQEELTAVRADPTQMKALVQNWVETPAFEFKLKEFLKVALQQRYINDLVDQSDSLNFPGPRRNLLQSNVDESFARTAQKLVLAGRPFTEVLTTQEWEATTALLVLLAYTEFDDAEKRELRHYFYEEEPPEGAPEGTTSLAQSASTGFWYIQDFPDGCGVKSLRGNQIFDFLFGRINCNPQAYVPANPVVSDADFADWRTVKMSPTASRSGRINFWDMPALREATELPVTLPRVGFLTTPAFLGNWATNEDNQFRVAASQTMITALGREFIAGDLTEPLTLEGLDEVHSEPGSTCYGCHVLLDPMRNYFAQEFDTDYQRNVESLALNPGFAFRGEASEGGDIYEFAARIAEHPLFSAAWVQKLCYYANSQACDEDDPEFIRLVTEFQSSGYDMKKLFVE